MTPVIFHFVTPTGEPLINALVEIQLSQPTFEAIEDGVQMPRLITATTDSTGFVTVPLLSGTALYYVTVMDPESEAGLSYKFLVPDQTAPVRFQDIVVEGVLPPLDYSSAALLIIQDAKASATTSSLAASASAATASSSATTATNQVAIATTKAGEAAVSAAAALVSENTAAGSASSATTQANNSASSASTAATQAGVATTQATNAASSATAASTSASTASTQASNAGTSATNSAASATAAATSATNAAGSATTATTKAGEASSSADAAANSAAASATSAAASLTSQNAGATSASNAATSASNAATSATNASTSAGTATTQASNASTSATSALESANAAATSATNAAASATAANTSASTATTQAGNASTSATNAAASATSIGAAASTASTQATNAANSAAAAATSATAAAAATTSKYDKTGGTISGNVSVTGALDTTGSVSFGTTSNANGRLTSQAGTSESGYSAFFYNLDGTYNPYVQIGHDSGGTTLNASSSSGGNASRLHVGVVGIKITTTSSTGLAVTGSVSATGAISGSTAGVRLPTASPVYFNAGFTTYIQEVSAGVLQFVAGGVAGATLDASGNLNMTAGGHIGRTAAASGIFFNTNSVLPSAGTGATDNTVSVGSASYRWTTIYATTGAINTSDARAKTKVRTLADAEIEAAIEHSKEIGIFQWLDAVAKKGEKARQHIGMTVQRSIEIMYAHGLDPMAYAFICHDVWGDEFVEHPAIPAVEAKAAVLDDAGNEIEPAVEAVEGKDAWTEQTQFAGDRYAFRYDQLNLFIARGIEARLAALEARA